MSEENLCIVTSKLRFCYFSFEDCKIVSAEVYIALVDYLNRRFTYYFNKETQYTVYVSIGFHSLDTPVRTWDGFDTRTKRLTIKVLKE